MGGQASRPHRKEGQPPPAVVRPRLIAIGGGEFWIVSKEEVGHLLNTEQLLKLNDSTYRLLSSPAMIFTPRVIKDLINIVGESKFQDAIRGTQKFADMNLLSGEEEVECFYLVCYVDAKPHGPSELDSPDTNHDFVNPMSRRSSAASFITPLPSCTVEDLMPVRNKLAIEAPPEKQPPETPLAEADDEDVATVPQGEENTGICLNAQATNVAEVIDSFVEGVESGQSEIGETPPPSQRRRVTRRRPTSARAGSSKVSPKLPKKWELYCINENNPASTHRQKREQNKSPSKTSPPPASKRIRS